VSKADVTRGAPAVAAAVLFVCYLRQSQTVAVGSDGASNALQAWDMLHGNLLLHGWWLSDVSFYTTELPQYMLVEAVHGLGPGVIHIAGAMTYTLLVLLAAFVARGRSSGRDGAYRALLAGGVMLAPQLGSGTMTLVLSPDHTGTAIPALLVLLLLDRARPHWYVPVSTGVLLAWALIADTMILVIVTVPLVIVCALRVYQGMAQRQEAWKAQWHELSLAAAAIASVPVASVATHLIRAAGGWNINPLETAFASWSVMPRNLWLTVEGFLELFGADMFGQGSGRETVFAIIHLAGAILAGWAIWVAVRRFFSSDLIVQVMVLAIILNLGAYAVSVQPSNILSTREIAPVLPFAAVLAGRLLVDRVLADRRAPWALAVVFTCYAAMLGFNAAQPAVPAQYASLTAWLADHHLTSGVSGYSEANSVTLDSSGAVTLRAVTSRNGYVVPYTWETDSSWFSPAEHYASYAVLNPAGPLEVSEQQAIATFGKPAQTRHYQGFAILVWNENILSRLS
jgi:hypothetical protein